MDKPPSMGGDAADLGTGFHAVAERWVVEEWYKAYPDLTVVARLWDEEYHKLFSDNRRYSEGLDLCLGWVKRQDWSDREVLFAETKQTIEIPTSIGQVPFNYIWDRCDRRSNGDIEIIDYKTYSRPVSSDDLRNRIQPRFYAMAAQLAYPDAKCVWVTFDLIRYEPVGIVFTKAENEAAWAYLLSTAERIIADEGDLENLNSECRYCLRRFECETLTKHAAAGGSLGITDPFEAADRRVELAGAVSALTAMVEELDQIIMEYCESEETTSYETETTKVRIGAQRRRQIDTKQAIRILGDGVVASHSKLSIAMVDDLLKGKTITDEQKSRLKQLVQFGYGSPSVKAEKKTVLT